MNFSVAMATYNGAQFIHEQLASIADQSHLPAELVVCDDGSSDETLVIVERFATTAPFPVRIQRNAQTLGTSGNFLKAAALCEHAWIAFSDQDDVWSRDKLKAIADVVEQNPSLLLVAHRALIVDERLRPSGRLLHVPSVRRVTINTRLSRPFWSYPYGFTIAFHGRLVREFAIETRPIVSHDRWVFVLANALGETAFLPQSLALYRRHGRNASQFQPERGIRDEVTDPQVTDELCRAAQIVGSVADYFEDQLASLRPRDARLLSEAAHVYRRMAAFLAQRARLLGPDFRSIACVSAYLQLIASGGYGSPTSGGLGLRAAVKDAVRMSVAALQH